MMKHGDISSLLRVSIISLCDPNKLLPIYEENDVDTSDLLFELQLCSGSQVLADASSGIIKLPCQGPMSTIDLPMAVQDVDSESYYVLTLKSTFSSRPIAATVLSLFTTSVSAYDFNYIDDTGQAQLRQGRYQLFLWPGKKPSLSETPGIIENYPEMNEIYRLTRSIEQASQSSDKIPWLDNRTIPTMKKRIAEICQEVNLSLIQIELPNFGQVVLYGDIEYEVEFGKRGNPDMTVTFIDDYELGQINPSNDLYLRLMRTEAIDHRHIKLTPEIKERLDDILLMPDSKQLSPEDRNTVWRYRYSLADKPHALTKFLNAVNWEQPGEGTIAREMIDEWAPVNKEDSLHLLSVNFCCNSYYPSIESDTIQYIRKYAVSRLATCADEELHSILLQLVQALRYEDWIDSPLFRLLVERAQTCIKIGIQLYWFLKVEVESATGKVAELYGRLFHNYVEAIKNTPIDQTISTQILIKNRLLDVGGIVRKKGGDTSSFEKKKEKIKALIRDPANGLYEFTRPMLNPLDCESQFIGIEPDMCSVFCSKTFPARIAFRDMNDKITNLMFKMGDDLRQDQLILQIITLLDLILKQMNLNFELTPYRSLATGISDGYIHLVPNSTSIFDRIQGKQQLSEYLKENQENNPEIYDTWVNSCAGYCVITYILGIGDRHLENLMVNNKGNLFHIDFGFILGKDPKPYPPPMKLCKEMVEGMGGDKSAGYEKFKVKCCECFLELRKHGRLIVNLFHLMIHSGALGVNDPLKAIEKLHDRFRMDINDEEAEKFLLDLLEASITNLMPQLMEKIHAWALYWRKL